MDFKISGTELKSLIRLFTDDNPSQTEVCLNALHQILANQHTSRPFRCLTYPMPALSGVSLPDTPDTSLHASIVRIRESVGADLRANESCWRTAAVAIPVPVPKLEQLWNSSNKSFSVAFWFYYDECKQTMNRVVNRIDRQHSRSHQSEVHLMSVAMDSTTIEVWFDFQLSQFVYRLCQLIGGKVVVQAEDVHINIGDLSGKWHLLRFNVREQYRRFQYQMMKKSSSVLSISKSIDGISEQTVKLNSSNVIPRRPQSMTLLFGTTDESQFRWQSGNVMLFRGNLSPESTLCLYCLGSDFANLSHSEANGKHRSLSIPRHLVDSNLNEIISSLYEMSKPERTDSLDDNIVMIYKPSKCDHFLVYPNKPGVNNSYLPNISKISFPITSIRLMSNTWQTSAQHVKEHRVLAFCEITSQTYYGPHKAVFDIGGIGVFLFLFAHIVDISSEEHIQSKALELVLQVFDSHSEHRDVFFDKYDGLSLITLILENPKAIISETMLKNFMLFFVSGFESNAIITSSKGMTTAITSWKAWHRNPHTTKAFYQTLYALISHKNFYKNFNVQQMKRSNVLQSIVFLIQEMYIELNHRKDLHLSKDCLSLVLRILKTLIGRPVDISLLSEVFDCVLLLHKAESAFISNSRNSFYYLFPSVWNIDLEMVTQRTPSLIIDDIDVEEWGIISEDEISMTEEVLDDCPDHMIAGLIELIGDTIRSLDEDRLDKVIGPVINLEYLVILANNKSFRVRECVMTALYVCVKRCKSSEVMTQFCRTKGFHLVANQLHRYPASPKLVNICFGLLLEVNDLTEFTLEDTLDMKKCFEDWHSQLFVPLMAILPKTVYDISLSHNALQTFFRLITSFSIAFLKEIYENGLFECLAKVLINHNIYKQKSKVQAFDTIDGYEEDLINQDVNMILKEVSSILYSSSGPTSHQIYTNALDFFSVMEKKSLQVNRQSFRECRISMFESAFDCIQSVADETKSVAYKNNKLAAGVNTAELFFNMFAAPEENYESGSIGPNNENLDSSSFTSFDSTERFRNNQTKVTLHSKEIIERFKELMVRSIDFILLKDEAICVNEKEKYFSRSILHIMCQIMEMIQTEGSVGRKKNHWISILYHCRETIRCQIARLFLYLISPVQSKDDRHFSISLITSFNFFTHLIKSNEEFSHNFKSFLLDLIDLLGEGQGIRDLHHLIEVIDSQSTAPSDKHYKQVITDWFDSLSQARRNQELTVESLRDKCLNRMRPLGQKVSETATAVTRAVVDAQNKERKQYIYNLKRDRTNSFMLKKTWKSIVNQFTHERAVWHFPDSFPNSWSLDPTEGPNRIRRKVKRCFLGIDNRFFIDKSSHRHEKQLLSYIFNTGSDPSTDANSSAMIDRLHANERIIYTSKVSVITPDQEFPGEILISNSCIHFVSEGPETNGSVISDILTEVLAFEEIQEIQKRRYQLQNNALEMFLTNGQTYLIAFESSGVREEFLTQISGRNLPNLAESKNLVALTQMWRERQISNFEYLSHLNKISGRTFNDLMQYPIFPVILADYESAVLDLTEAKSFRNLSKPMAIQNRSREKYYIEQYNYLKTEYERNAANGEHMMAATTAPFHYGAHYSNSGTVLHFLVRLPPFTQMFLNYQDNNFDIPDRTFHSMATSWRLATAESTTDFKEFIPEFFFLPEFLMNNENFDLGVRQSGERVHNVHLPAWSRNNARLFVFVNRQALESNHVTKNLRKWIDLVFGYKQTGKAAIDAINVFHPSTYYGTDISKIEDPLRRMAIQTMIKTFGQMPRQLFNTPHPLLLQHIQLPKERGVPQVMPEVIGLKWGSYVGSPSELEPNIAFKKSYSVPISQLIALSTNDVFGLPSDSTLFASYSRQKGGALINAFYITSKALFQWSTPDSSIKVIMDSSTVTFNEATVTLDEISICKSVVNHNVLLVGYASGLVNAYVIGQPLKSGQSIALKASQTTLYGHSSPVKSIAMSKSFSIAVTGDADGLCIVWDLNRFCYVRTLCTHESAIDSVTISETLGDIVSVYRRFDTQNESSFAVHTINGEVVGRVDTDSHITAVCHSSAPEGQSVNVIATAFADGSIKLWTSWDLTCVRVLRADIELPIVCLTYSNDNQLLYVAYSDQSVIVWENGSNRRTNRTISLTLL